MCGGVGFQIMSGGGGLSSSTIDPSSSNLFITSHSLSIIPTIHMLNFLILNLSHLMVACQQCSLAISLSF